MAKSTITGLTVTIGADTKAFSKAIKEIDAEARNIAKDLKTVNENLKLDSKDTEKAADKLKLLQEAAKTAATKVETIKKAIEALNKQYAEGKVSPEDYKNSLEKLERQLESATREQDLANAKVKQFGQETETAGKGALSLGDIIKGNLISDAIKSGLHAVADAARAIGEAVWNALKTIAKGIADFTKDSLSIAEENRQTLAKVGQVFGENAQQIIDWSKKAVDAFGLTSGKAQENAAVFGNMFVALGLGSDQAAEMSMNMVQLAADIAAFNNTTTEAVLEDFQSMLAGTSRTVRKYGIVLTEAAVKQKAVDMGLAESTKDVDDAAKAIARYTLMVEQTTHQSGQFARESGSATVQIQKLQARILEIKGTIGEKLIPVQAKLLELANEFLSNPAILDLIDRAVEKIGKLSEAFVALFDGIDANDLSGTFENILQQIVDKILVLLPALIQYGGEIIQTLVDGMNKYLPLILAEATPIITTLFNGIVANLPTIINGALQILQTLCDAITNNANLLAPIIADLILQLVQFITDNLPNIFHVAIDIVLEIVKGITNALPNLVPAAVSVIMKLVQILIENLPEIVNAAYQLIIGFANGLINSIPVITARLPEIITAMVNFLVNSLPQFIEVGFQLLSALVQNLPQIIQAIAVGLAEIVNSIINYFTNHWEDMKQVGRDLLTNIWDGIQSMGSWFENQFTSWISGIWSNIKSVFRNDAEESAPHFTGGGYGVFYSYANGGRALAGQMIQVNDDAGHRPEWFIPSVPGTILNGDQTERVMNNVNNSRNFSGGINIYVNSYGMNVAEVADELGAAFQNRIRMSGAMI